MSEQKLSQQWDMWGFRATVLFIHDHRDTRVVFIDRLSAREWRSIPPKIMNITVCVLSSRLTMTNSHRLININVSPPLSHSLSPASGCMKMQHRKFMKLTWENHSELFSAAAATHQKERRTVLWTERAMTSQVLLGTKICSVQRDSCSDHSESWLLPFQLPSHNISRELQLDWAKSGLTWRHQWVSGQWRFLIRITPEMYWFGKREARVMNGGKGEFAWSLETDLVATTCLQLSLLFL